MAVNQIVAFENLAAAMTFWKLLVVAVEVFSKPKCRL